jgi:hypothetical protein
LAVSHAQVEDAFEGQSPEAKQEVVGIQGGTQHKGPQAAALVLAFVSLLAFRLKASAQYE